MSAGTSICSPGPAAGFESGVCNGNSAYGGVETYHSLSEVDGVDWMVDLDAPSGFSAVHIVDLDAAEEVARVQVGCTCFEYGDFDADGMVDVQDLIYLLGARAIKTFRFPPPAL